MSHSDRCGRCGEERRAHFDIFGRLVCPAFEFRAPSPPETPVREWARNPSPWMDPNHAFGPPHRTPPYDDRSRCERCHRRVIPSDFDPGEPVVCLECSEAAASPASAPRETPRALDADEAFGLASLVGKYEQIAEERGWCGSVLTDLMSELRVLVAANRDNDMVDAMRYASRPYRSPPPEAPASSSTDPKEKP